jgi:hypothetical protein
MARAEDEERIKVYKRRLSGLLDNRPSGTRQRLADALGKHRSFVTQITSPSYATPIPARHLPAIFSVCHFSPEERQRFLEDYHAAHPKRRTEGGDGRRMRQVSLTVHDLGDAERNRQFDEAVAEFARRMGVMIGERDE